MYAQHTKMIDFLGQPQVAFVIPMYQRVYTWQSSQLQEFWDDLMAAGARNETHFMGMVFYSCEENSAPDASTAQTFAIVDGQQRLTTLSLLIAALRNYLEKSGQTFCDLGASEIEDTYLRTSHKPTLTTKLTLTRADKPTMMWVAHLAEKPDDEEDFSAYINDAYQWFEERMDADDFNYAQFERGLSNLSVITIKLDQADRPQAVFESLNAKGLPLSLPDLVRNYVLMLGDQRGDADPHRLYKRYWLPVEEAFNGEDDNRYLMHAIRTWAQGKSSVNLKDEHDIFGAFKQALRFDNARKQETRLAAFSLYCQNFHRLVTAKDTATLEQCRTWEENRGKADKLSNDRKIFGD